MSFPYRASAHGLSTFLHRQYIFNLKQGIVATLVQMFFAWRIRILTRNWFFVAPIAITSLAGLCTTFLSVSGRLTEHYVAGSIVTAASIGVHPNFQQFQAFKVQTSFRASMLANVSFAM